MGKELGWPDGTGPCHVADEADPVCVNLDQHLAQIGKTHKQYCNPSAADTPLVAQPGLATHSMCESWCVHEPECGMLACQACAACGGDLPPCSAWCGNADRSAPATRTSCSLKQCQQCHFCARAG